MTANYPVSILPPNATAVERAIDRASAAALTSLPVHLICWVKDPDSCPLALLPWLAWEYQVDTWNINWSEQKKRDAIKRAHYIHRHRGTVAAVRHALVDSPFGTDIVEWFNQNPKGDPYTFRLNVHQNDLPVTEYDQQDLKIAVLRARNLRSWFSVHVFGRLQGASYAAGYMYATEKIMPHFVPLQVALSRYTLNLAPGDAETVTVTILPEYAEDKTFTVNSSDSTMATARIVNGAIVVTGVKRGSCSVTVTTANGVSAVIAVKVVAVLKFVSRIDNLASPLFYVRLDEDFTIDYGDGIDSRDYRFVNPGAVWGWVVTTRPLEVGREYTITVKNTESATLQRVEGAIGMALNPVREIICVTGERDSLDYFAEGATSLTRVHKGAFADLPNIQQCRFIFRNCTSLVELPEGLFSGLRGATDFTMAFYGCTALTIIPDGLFSGLSHVISFESVFGNCTLLRSTGNNTFRGCACATQFLSAFSRCISLTETGTGVFAGCSSGYHFGSAFNGCRALKTLSDDLFSDVPGGLFTAIFQNCIALEALPSRLFRNCLEATHFGGAFSGCSQLASVPDEFFKDLPLVTYFGTVFYGCSSLVTVGSAVFSGCIGVQTFSSAFYNCRIMESVGDDIFRGCISATSFSSVFSGCQALTGLPSFADCRKATTFSDAFYSCRSLTVIRAEAFAGMSLVTTFYEAFAQCTSLASIGAGAFRDCSALTNIQYMFMGCTSLESLAGDIFAGCIKVTSLTHLFNKCSQLATVPETLFSDMISLKALGTIFLDCTALAAVPSGLFAGCVNITSLTMTFSGCTALSALPADLLRHNTLVTSVDSTFYGCTTLAGIPASLFTSCPLITGFNATFQNTGVVEIPESLFSGNPNVTAYVQTFSGCKHLRSVPAGLFATSIKATTLANTFAGCVALTEVGAGLLNSTPATTVGYLFDGCALLRTDVNAIFDLSGYPDIVTTTATFRGCAVMIGRGLVFMGKVPNVTAHYYAFSNCASLDDYDALPGNWIANKL